MTQKARCDHHSRPEAQVCTCQTPPISKVALNRLNILLDTPTPGFKVQASIHDAPECVVHNAIMFTELSDAHGGGPPPLGATAAIAQAATPSTGAPSTAGIYSEPAAHTTCRQGQGGDVGPAQLHPKHRPRG
jgi:hypothetical protein